MSDVRRPRRLGPATNSALATLGVVIGVGVVLSIFTVVPASTTQVVAAGPGGSGGSTLVSTPTTTTTGHSHGRNRVGGGPVAGGVAGRTVSSTSTQPGSVPPATAGLTCSANGNGGATDTGVSAGGIKFAATTVTDGPGASFLAPMNEAMQAVTNQVNRSGGVCGRRLDLTLTNDSWQAALGEQYIQNFVEGDRVFGLAVNPDSEGLYAADSFIRTQGVPVVGTGGMLIHEYQNPWIWPVGTSTISQMHVMVQDAYNRGARHFGIVFDAKYHFGIEGAYAFDQAVKRLTGADVPGYDPSLSSCTQRFCGIQPAESSYAGQATQFGNSCYQGGHTNQSCDFVAYLLEPDVALSWLSNNQPAQPAYGEAGAQPLFDRQAFADQCSACDIARGFTVWTGYQPPEGSFSGQPADAGYVNLMHSFDSSLDVDNQFVEGAYVGMNLLVTALHDVGPDLTRARLKGVLDGLTYASGLTRPLVFSSGNHFANSAAMGWKLDYSNGQFTGFSPATTFETDPWLGQDVPAGR